MDGILNVLKPPGMTSHDVVALLRSRLRPRKIGHTGTLDPNVAGVLPVCLGQATRITEYLLEANKGYRAELKLGINTVSQDAFGPVEAVASAAGVTREAVDQVFTRFIGPIAQIPPMLSALKQQGKRLYEMARAGIEVERPAREVTIFSLELLSFDQGGSDHPSVRFDVVCSKGTYIRTLCADLGAALGCGGHMSYLVRTMSGPFTLTDAATLAELAAAEAAGRLNDWLKPLDYPLAGLPALELTGEAVRAVTCGQKINNGFSPLGTNRIESGPFRLYSPTGEFLAIGGLDLDGLLSPHKVFGQGE